MDQNNMYQPDNTGAQPTGQAQNPYMQPAGQGQNPYMAPVNQQPAYQPPVESDDVTMGEWMWTMLLLCIPIVNFILILVWAFGGGVKPSKANFCKAYLVWMLIGVGLSILLVIFGTVLGAGLVNYIVSYR